MIHLQNITTARDGIRSWSLGAWDTPLPPFFFVPAIFSLHSIIFLLADTAGDPFGPVLDPPLTPSSHFAHLARRIQICFNRISCCCSCCCCCCSCQTVLITRSQRFPLFCSLSTEGKHLIRSVLDNTQEICTVLYYSHIHMNCTLFMKCPTFLHPTFYNFWNSIDICQCLSASVRRVRWKKIMESPLGFFVHQYLYCACPVPPYFHHHCTKKKKKGV